MVDFEYIIYSMMFSTLSHIKLGQNILLDSVLILFGLYYIFTKNNNIKEYCSKRYNKYFSKQKNVINITNTDDERSLRFKSIMYYVQNNWNKSITGLSELSSFRWVYNSNTGTENFNESSSMYEIFQDEEFIITDGIHGTLTCEQKENSSKKENDTSYYKEYELKLYSTTLNVIEIKSWIEEQVKIYEKYLRDKTHENQLLLSITYGEELKVEKINWDSVVTFENSYFHDKENILRQLDFFLNNKEWYVEHGIPYNLGILLYGEPGCGKSRFIKQLLNYTKRHGIDIKLHNKFSFDSLKEIIFNEEIDNEYIIPQDKRIIIFEDIDAVGDIIKPRKDNKKDMLEEIKKAKENGNEKEFDQLKQVILLDSIEKDTKNNLSYFLNILDGINECTGRIIIFTTNHIENIDPALIRPGRIDIKIHCTKCTVYDIHQLIKNFWNKEVHFIDDSFDKKYTSAEVINIFRTLNNFEDVVKHFTKMG